MKINKKVIKAIRVLVDLVGDDLAAGGTFGTTPYRKESNAVTLIEGWLAQFEKKAEYIIFFEDGTSTREFFPLHSEDLIMKTYPGAIKIEEA